MLRCPCVMQYLIVTYIFPVTERRNTPPSLVAQQVYVLGLGPNCSPNVSLEYNDLLGTCFAVTKRHLLTACHVLFEDETSLFDVKSGKAVPGKALIISRSGGKVDSKVSFPNPMEVRVLRLSEEYDWALLELVDPSLTFPAFFSLCGKSELPQLIVETVDLKAFFAPIGYFRQSLVTDLAIWPDEYHRVLQYDRNDTNIVVSGGLYLGCCGCPYVNRAGKVVAMHLASDNEGQNVSLVKPVSTRAGAATTAAPTSAVETVVDTVTNMAAVYASTRVGVVLANVPEVLELVNIENAKVENLQPA